MFDFSKPIQFYSDYLKHPHQTLYPIFLSHLSELFEWQCMWCIYSAANDFFNYLEHPLPHILIGYCPNNPTNFYKRLSHKACKYFTPIDEYKQLMKEGKIHNRIKMKHDFFFIL